MTQKDTHHARSPHRHHHRKHPQQTPQQRKTRRLTRQINPIQTQQPKTTPQHLTRLRRPPRPTQHHRPTRQPQKKLPTTLHPQNRKTHQKRKLPRSPQLHPTKRIHRTLLPKHHLPKMVRHHQPQHVRHTTMARQQHQQITRLERLLLRLHQLRLRRRMASPTQPTLKHKTHDKWTTSTGKHAKVRATWGGKLRENRCKR